MNKMASSKAYNFDTSAFLALYRHHTQVLELPQSIWDLLGRMIRNGSIVSHRYVYDEVVNEKADKPDMITQWLIPRKECFEKESADQAILVGEIVAEFPKLIDHEREKEQADPWIIAQTMILNKQTRLFEDKEYVIVTQENPNSTRKIPAACKHFKVRSISLKQFFEENNVAVEKVNK